MHRSAERGFYDRVVRWTDAELERICRAIEVTPQFRDSMAEMDAYLMAVDAGVPWQWVMDQLGWQPVDINSLRRTPRRR